MNKNYVFPRPKTFALYHNDKYVNTCCCCCSVDLDCIQQFQIVILIIARPDVRSRSYVVNGNTMFPTDQTWEQIMWFVRLRG